MSDDPLDYFRVDDFQHNLQFLEKHSHLIAEADESYFDFQILIFPDNLTKELVIKHAPSYIDKPILVGDIDNLSFDLSEIAARNSLFSQEPIITRTTDNLLTSESEKEIYYHTASYETSVKKIKVLYYDIKGYQRKGMNPQFYDDFINYKLYFEKSWVLKASSYLNTGDDELKTHFKTNFIDNFIEGESFFFGFW